MSYEAPKRRSCDRIAVPADRSRAPRSAAGVRRAAAELAAHRRRLLDLTTTADPDTDPTDAMLLRVEAPRPARDPTALLTLGSAALRSPR